jgi:hypothetical protein
MRSPFPCQPPCRTSRNDIHGHDSFAWQLIHSRLNSPYCALRWEQASTLRTTRAVLGTAFKVCHLYERVHPWPPAMNWADTALHIPLAATALDLPPACGVDAHKSHC